MATSRTDFNQLSLFTREPAGLCSLVLQRSVSHLAAQEMQSTDFCHRCVREIVQGSWPVLVSWQATKAVANLLDNNPVSLRLG